MFYMRVREKAEDRKEEEEEGEERKKTGGKTKERGE